MSAASTRGFGRRLLTAHIWEDVRGRTPYRIARTLEGIALCSDLGSLRRWLAARPDGPQGTLELRLRPLRGNRFHLRTGTADVWALADTFLPAEHLPPAELDPAGVRTIWDLGANIGASMAHLALLHPHARVLGVELDEQNAALCRRNVEPWADRCELLVGAVWSRDGEVGYRRDGLDVLSFRVEEGLTAGADGTVPALSLDTLLARQGGGTVDFVKMDVEGAEQAILRESTSWAQQVRAIKVEVHEPYTVEECVVDLERLGFRAWPEAAHRGTTGKPPVIGVRDGALSAAA